MNISEATVNGLHEKILTDANTAKSSRSTTFDELGNVTTFTDGEGQVRTIKDAAGKITTIERNPAGQVIRQIDSLNNKVEKSYDSLGRLKTMLDGKQNTITLNYKDDGSKPRHQPDTIQYPKFKRSFEYDTRGRVTKITDEADGNSRLSGEFTYTKTGQRQTVKDAEGNTSKYEYDPLGRLEKIIDAYLKETLFAYDSQDNLLSVTDPQGSTTQYRYDRAGRQTQEIRPLQQSYQFDYDERGSLSRLIDPKGNETAYHYNPDGQLTQQQLYAQSNLQTPERTTEYHYTRSGQLESYADGLSSANYSYTPTHQLQTETTHYGSFSKTVGYSYYDNGDLKTLTDPEGKINEYRYDANRQLESVTIPGVGIYTISSYDWFAPEEISWPGGTKRAIEYDGLMQLKTITVKDPAETTQMAYAYSYDNAGNIKTKATEHGNYVYQYDNLYRLLEAQNPNSDTEQFTYDPVGNRKTTEKSPTPWLYNANHELQSRPQISYEYDANGSTTQITQDGQNTHLIYNAANRLAEIKNNDNQTVANYQYDPFGRRISKEVNGTTTYFIYTPQGLAGEYTSTGTLIRGYGYKPGGHWMTDPLYLKTGNTREQYFFYQNDHLGTPQKLMSTTGAIVWSAKYEAFGKYTTAPLQATAQPVENPLRFAGQYEDQETGWHYNWYRYYSPELGRYITSDPIGLEGGLNTFAYVGGNPQKFSDPTGEFAIFAPVVGFVVIGVAIAVVSYWIINPPKRVAYPVIPRPIAPTLWPNLPELLQPIVVAAVAIAADVVTTKPRDIWTPERKSGMWNCKARADCNDNIPGNCPEDSNKRFSFGGGFAPNLGEARNIAKSNATHNLGCQPKHVSCKCISAKGKVYSGGC